MDDIMGKALKEIEVVKMMIANEDYMGARTKLHELWHHFPALDGISGMITVCDILSSAGYGFLGCGTNWYWVLQIMRAAGEADIRYQFHKFKRLLDPIKTSFPGTESALKMIQDAFSVLSDPEKRAVFDLDLDSTLECGFVGENLVHKEDIAQISVRCSKSVCDTSDGINEESNSKECSLKRIINQDLLGEMDLHNAGMPTQAELINGVYDLIEERDVHDPEIPAQIEVTNGIHADDEQRKVTCTQERSMISACVKRRITVGTEKTANSMSSSVVSDCSSDKSSWSVKSKVGKNCFPVFYNFEYIRKPQLFTVGQVWAAYDDENMPRKYARINSIYKFPFRLHISWLIPAPVTAHERRWCEVGLPVVCGFFNVDRNETVVTEPKIFSHMINCFASRNEQLQIYPQNGDIWAMYKDWKPFEWCSNPEARKGCILRMVEIIAGCSNPTGVMAAGLVKVEWFKNVFQRFTNNGNEHSFPIPAKNFFVFSHKVPAFRFTGGEMDRISNGMLELDPLAVPDVLDCIMAKPVEGSSSGSPTFLHSCPIPPVPESLNWKWSANNFASNQIWAVYVGPDSMPRKYVVVNNVVSGSEVCVTFLEPHPKLDNEVYWVGEKLPFVCGSFRAGKTTINLGMSRFSHLVKCEYSTNGFSYGIYPKKGEIWAMYRNWNSKWKQSDLSYYQCCIVEIVTDFSEESGLMAARLVEVPGYTTFFKRQVFDGFEMIRTIPRAEMLSFSHRIAAFTVPGVEIHGIPEDSWHLEPDALPPNLSNEVKLQRRSS